MTKIKDVYAGKPDAKDEIETDGLEAFFSNYVVPENFNMNALLNGDGYFITGYKGTGKTAVLYYLDYMLKEKDPLSSSSFIFFKGDYTDNKKEEMELLARRITSIISISNDVALSGTDFEYIWRWLFYIRIVSDNDEYNGGLFEENDEWFQFKKKINQIKQQKTKFLSIPPKFSFSTKISDQYSGSSVEPKAEIDFQNAKLQETSQYRTFIQIIDEADEIFKSVKRTDIPYYIFVDELEAYFGEENIFKRDLRLIRDLLFTVKKLNLILKNQKSVKTKIVCSVRSEVINSIYRFIIPKELNKVVAGFEAPLIWDYTTTNSYSHPILRILISRIRYGEKINGNEISDKELINKWFPEKINNKIAANYILDNTWCKPRDIVRLIASAQNCLAAENESFSQKTIDLSRKRYSQDSLVELKEELRALYSPDQINFIIQCLTGFKRIFTSKELQNRSEEILNNSFVSDNINTILSDLYRIGIIGNYNLEAKTFRWQHKGDDEVIIENNIWKLIIHPALMAALSVNARQDNAYYFSHRQNRVNNIKEGEHVKVTIEKFIPYFAIGYFYVENKRLYGSIHISEVSNYFVTNFEDYLSIGEKYDAVVLGYAEKYGNWNLSIKRFME